MRIVHDVFVRRVSIIFYWKCTEMFRFQNRGLITESTPPRQASAWKHAWRRGHKRAVVHSTRQTQTQTDRPDEKSSWNTRNLLVAMKNIRSSKFSTSRFCRVVVFGTPRASFSAFSPKTKRFFFGDFEKKRFRNACRRTCSSFERYSSNGTWMR